jgi:hypothetical protein
MTRWIENVSRDDVRKGTHTDMGSNAMLIQIADPAAGFPTPLKNFKEVHQFEFLDIEDSTPNDGSPQGVFLSEFKITQEQANELVRLLKHASDNHMNVLVHCHAGICRSGAVVEVGEKLGFTSTGRWRLPNLLVKRLMLNACGISYTQQQEEYDRIFNQNKCLGWAEFE